MLKSQDSSTDAISLLCVAGPGNSTVHEKYELDDYIFAFTTEVNGKTTSESEENNMTVYVKTLEV